MINLIFFFGLVVGVIIFGLTLNVIWNRSKEGAYGLMAMHLSLMFLFSYYSLEETEGAVVFVIQPIIIAGLLYSIRLMERHEKIQCSGVWQAEADADVARYKAFKVQQYRKAAEQNDPDAQFTLGYMYEEGLRVEKDLGKAIKWYRKAAEQNHTGAQFKLGVMYEEGLGVDKDDKEAAKWYRKAAEQGDNDAKTALKEISERQKPERELLLTAP